MTARGGFDRLSAATGAANVDLMQRLRDGKARAKLLEVLCLAGEELAGGGDPFAIARWLEQRLAREVRGNGLTVS